MFGLIGAMNVEIEELLRQLENREDRTIGMDVFSAGKLFGRDVVLSVCGPGKVNAALCAQNMITAYAPEWVLNLGVAGAGCDGLSIGDMVIATAAVQHDMDTSPIGDPVGFVSKIGLIQIPCDPVLREQLASAAGKVEGVRVWEGIIATGDRFICTAEDRENIHAAFGSMAVEMEGGAVAHACYINHVPCGVLRSISDGANSDSTMDYPAFTRMAAAHSVQVVRNLLNSL